MQDYNWSWPSGHRPQRQNNECRKYRRALHQRLEQRALAEHPQRTDDAGAENGARPVGSVSESGEEGAVGGDGGEIGGPGVHAQGQVIIEVQVQVATATF